ncbi:uncharacterized protein GLRG_01600 [Colletotrichum graminicola M1.001]|uniref:Uncharacterized protein n=1 Tax=Colletotrichum graminicola (strain M1.001 / M2 / FGSC 10212) TaxID=645133 RepID=E3Q6K8_COLGM|nr:uncharacterized protein GLRG_01600 [Colletotrichum graminicola M1.001]EFQ26456.1 hypothetical protein GLRG_01600 [Colletotrichum graminicola M1.001]
MCFTHVKYSCNHNEKCVLKCRKLWSARTSWCCYPAFLFTFGWPNEEPCSDFVERKAFFSPKTCPECTEAEQSAPQTRGIVPSKYRHKLTPEALNTSRQRMKEREKEDAVKERWYTREENFQETLRKWEQEERLNRDVVAGSTAKTDKALPDMPSFIHVPLGDRWGDPSYHYPPHIADVYDAAPLTPPRNRGRSGSTGISNLSKSTMIDTARIVTGMGRITLRAQSMASGMRNISQPCRTMWIKTGTQHIMQQFRTLTPTFISKKSQYSRRSCLSRRDGGTGGHKPWSTNVLGLESPVAEAPTLRLQ